MGYFPLQGAGGRESRIVLVEDREHRGGPGYALKKYHSVKKQREGETSDHEEIWLHSLNSDDPPIKLDRETEGRYWILGWFVGSVRKIARVRGHKFGSIDGE